MITSYICINMIRIKVGKNILIIYKLVISVRIYAIKLTLVNSSTIKSRDLYIFIRFIYISLICFLNKL